MAQVTKCHLHESGVESPCCLRGFGVSTIVSSGHHLLNSTAAEFLELLHLPKSPMLCCFFKRAVKEPSDLQMLDVFLSCEVISLDYCKRSVSVVRNNFFERQNEVEREISPGFRSCQWSPWNSH